MWYHNCVCLYSSGSGREPEGSHMLDKCHAPIHISNPFSMFSPDCLCLSHLHYQKLDDDADL